MKTPNRQVKSRNEKFSKQVTTEIWHEIPSEDNPYLATDQRCYGYSITDLLEKCSFTETFYLLMTGQLPSEGQKDLLEKLMIAFINLGPRHPATRAAMAAGASKTDTAHLLPISLSILGGEHSGGRAVANSMRFFQQHQNDSPEQIVQEVKGKLRKQEQDGDWQPLPGYGTKFNSIDIFTKKLVKTFTESPGAGKILKWATHLDSCLQEENCGLLPAGLIAATFCDLNFSVKAAPGLFQLLCSPGLVAHGSEFSNKPMTAMPFPKDEDYFIE